MKNTILPFLLFFASLLFAQEEPLPRGYTDHELALVKWAAFTTPPPDFAIEEPPPYPVRHMAEWEELQALAITWRAYPEILKQIAFHAALEVKVLVFCRDQATKTTAETTLQNAGTNMANVEFIIEPNNSVWIRDYGPNCVYANDVDSLNFIDWVYNRSTRPDDDALPDGAAEHLNIPLYSTTLNPDRMVNTGGNFMSDGLGTAFASKLILDENDTGNDFNAGPHTEAEIDQIMQSYMGIDRYVKMETLPFDEIHHIDMHMRLLDEETLLVGEYPTGIADGPQIEANLQYVLDNFNSSFGTPFKVVRVLQPPAAFGYYPPNGDYRTYTNAVFVNKTILVPGYEMQFDTIAERIYKENFPGYKVVFINCNGMIGASGALHCITKEIGAADPLLIVHQRHPDVENNDLVDGYDLTASIQHKSGIESVTVFYSTDTTQAYQPLPMQPTGVANEWTCTIPHQANGTKVFYHISAAANSGKTQVRPLAAPQGYYEFDVNQLVSDTDELQVVTMQAIYPNPASGRTVVPVAAASATHATINLTDVLGHVVQPIFKGILPSGSSRHYFDAALLPKGIYFVNMRTALGISSQKLVVK